MRIRRSVNRISLVLALAALGVLVAGLILEATGAGAFFEGYIGTFLSAAFAFAFINHMTRPEKRGHRGFDVLPRK